MNSSYWFGILPLSTTKASEVCKGLEAELVSVESQLEDAYLTSVLHTINKKYGKPYIYKFLMRSKSNTCSIVGKMPLR